MVSVMHRGDNSLKQGNVDAGKMTKRTDYAKGSDDYLLNSLEFFLKFLNAMNNQIAF